MRFSFSTIVAFISPPRRWRVPVIIVLGIAAGIGLDILAISRAPSYFFDDPEVCMNCHVMSAPYAMWAHGNHHYAANCNGCHVPQDTMARKYLFKAMDGLRHSFVFTFRLEPQVIRIKHAGQEAVNSNCLRCHERTMSWVRGFDHDDGLCWRCHRNTPHGSIMSLAAAPYARVPKLNPVVPVWLTDLLVKTNHDKDGP